jgi:hypothetical protein
MTKKCLKCVLSIFYYKKTILKKVTRELAPPKNSQNQQLLLVC